VVEVRVRSWAELNEVLYAGSWKEELGRFRSDFAFRGREAAGDELGTSLGCLRDLLEQEGANVFTAEMLSQAAGQLREFDHLAGEPFVAFFEPASLDPRIVNQFALFSLMSNPAADLGAWLGEHPGLARRVILPRRPKWEVRDKLDQANVTERVLFPGLDGLSRWLRRQYTPTRRPAAARQRPVM
jgi:hypothetical protein